MSSNDEVRLWGVFGDGGSVGKQVDFPASRILLNTENISPYQKQKQTQNTCLFSSGAMKVHSLVCMWGCSWGGGGGGENSQLIAVPLMAVRPITDPHMSHNRNTNYIANGLVGLQSHATTCIIYTSCHGCNGRGRQSVDY